jgi:hypothetical protein
MQHVKVFNAGDSDVFTKASKALIMHAAPALPVWLVYLVLASGTTSH